MNLLYTIVLYAMFLSSGYCQTCKPVPKKTSSDVLATTSPIVVEVSLVQSKNLKHARKGTTFNVTAKVVHVFFHKNNGLTEGTEIQFGPVGRVKDCANLKSNSKYLLFLQEPDQDGFYWIRYNPMKSRKRTIRKFEKVLCKRCLVPPSFKKKSKTIKKSTGSKLRIKCKAGGKPRPALTWYYNDVLLTKSNIPKDFKVKKSKKSSSIEIPHVRKEYHDAKFKCSARNVASEHAANYTVTLKIKKVHVATCDKECGVKYANFCEHGHCCQEVEGRRCLCNKGWDGSRCNERSVRPLIRNKKLNKHNGQEHLAVALGTCLTLMAVSFVCLGTYCLFKRKRSKLLRKVLIVDGDRQIDASPMLTSYKNSEVEVDNINHFSTFTGSHSNIAADAHKQSFQVKLSLDRTSAGLSPRHDSGTSSSFSKLDREHARLVHKSSLTKGSRNGSTRSRLNGLAKSDTHLLTAKTNENAPNITTEALAQQHKEDDLKSSLNHHERHLIPALPLNSGLLSIVKHQPDISALPQSQESSGGDRNLIAESDIQSFHSSSPTAMFATKIMSTFDSSGDVKKKTGSHFTESLSTQSDVSTPNHIDNSNCALMPESLPRENTSQCKANVRIIESNPEDFFAGLNIPETSLRLDDDDPLHPSLKKSKGSEYSTNAVDHQDHFSKDSHTNPSFASAHLLRLPMLSKQATSPTDSGIPISCESVSCNNANFNDSESPERLV